MKGLAVKAESETIPENCEMLSTVDLMPERTSFSKFMLKRESLGPPALAFKVAYDLFKHPERFQGLVDATSGVPFRKKVLDGYEEFFEPEFYSNASVIFHHVKLYKNGSAQKIPVDRRHYVTPAQFNKNKFKYTKLTEVEHYNVDQLFFLQSINVSCLYIYCTMCVVLILS